MKKKPIILFLFLAGLFTILSCENTDDDFYPGEFRPVEYEDQNTYALTNSFELQNEEFKTPMCYYALYEIEKDTYEIQLVITNGIFNPQTSILENMTHYLLLIFDEMKFNNEFPMGKYEFEHNIIVKDGGYIRTGAFGIENGGEFLTYVISDGFMKINPLGGKNHEFKYEFNVSSLWINELIVNGYYRGFATHIVPGNERTLFDLMMAKR